MIRFSFFESLFCIGLLALNQPSANTLTITEDEIESQINRNCVRPDGTKVDFREIYHVRNTEIELNYNGYAYKIYANGESLEIEMEDNVFSYRIDRFVDDKKDMDVDLNFAYYRGEIFLYWVETYKHRPSMHGLLRIEHFIEYAHGSEPQSEVSYCRGSKGFWAAH